LAHAKLLGVSVYFVCRLNDVGSQLGVSALMSLSQSIIGT
tara:strand:+ start:6268 stop:6387 length:120 start_codon:yes stop_codon:yes gene_type:complete